MKIRSVVFGVCLFLGLIANAQQKKGIEYSGFFDSYYWRGPISITGGLGLAAYSGDLCSDFSCTVPKPYLSLGLGYKLWPRVFVGGELDYFSLSAIDKSPKRGFEFTSKNTELALYANFYLLEDIVKRHGDLITKKKLIKPYLTLGISGMRYSVSANVSETTFPKYTMLIPIGAGVLFDITNRFDVKLETNYKIAFTDYLDGVSQLASADKDDAYGVVRVKVVYTPGGKRIKPKKIKMSDEEKEKWNKFYSQSDSLNQTAPKNTAPDPEESDPYYNDEPKEEPVDNENNSEGTTPEEETTPTEENNGWDW